MFWFLGGIVFLYLFYLLWEDIYYFMELEKRHKGKDWWEERVNIKK